MILAVLLGAIGATGVLLVGSGWPRRPVQAPDTPSKLSTWWAETAASPEQLLVPVGVGVAGVVLTRWPAVAVIGFMAARIMMRAAQRRSENEAARAEAIALFTEQLRNAVGAADGVETVFGNSARHAPALIRPHVQAVAERLPYYESLDDALDELAVRLDHPIGDQVTRALGQAATQGGSLYDALDRLAKRARGLSEMHHRIEIAREQPRSTMRTVATIIIVFTTLLVLFARRWLEAYATPGGQIVLLVVAGWFALWFKVMGRMARIMPIERFYAPKAAQR